MKKNFIKTTTAAALLASAILVASPSAFAKTNTLDQSIQALKVELNTAAKQYVDPALSGNLAPSNLIYPTLKSVKKNYESTRKAITNSTLSSEEKDSKLKEIDALYNDKITKGLVPYIDAYNYAVKYLVPIMNDLKKAEQQDDFAAIEKGYHDLSAQLRERTSILYRFSGKAPRDLLLDQFKKPADQARDDLMLPVTVYMKLAELKGLYTAGKLPEALKVYEQLKVLAASLPSNPTDRFYVALQQELKKIEAIINGTPNLTPAPITTQEALDAKVAALVKASNANKDSKITLLSSVSNTLEIIVKEDISIVEFLGQDFYISLINSLGIQKINGNDPLSVAALNELKAAFPADAKTLADLKGKAFTFSITVTSGSDLAVNFTLKF
ncbi:hypothetical protein [Psychrobacillus antarcticus]|uniref:hypothetical protein n=1 Tax=Psychrobacillus antarcticus TaxID=2879115 RepID=UPI0024084BAF|nr:hypothetical protein [Psychrobacillus antarcticus]